MSMVQACSERIEAMGNCRAPHGSLDPILMELKI